VAGFSFSPATGSVVLPGATISVSFTCATNRTSNSYMECRGWYKYGDENGVAQTGIIGVIYGNKVFVPPYTSDISGGSGVLPSIFPSQYKTLLLYMGEGGYQNAYFSETEWTNYRYNATSPTATYLINQNVAPIISGNANEELGKKNIPFKYTYSVNDTNDGNILNVVEKLNGSQINTISNAPRNTNFTINITQEILNSLPVDQQNTIQISVTDGYSTTYKTITFTRINSGPTISNSDKDLGQVTREGIAEKYTCHDIEGNTFTVVEKVDDIEIKNTAGVDGTENTVNIPLNIWLELKNGSHTYTITATDSLEASTTRTFTFTKKETVIESTGLTNIIPTDIAATKILLTPNWIGKENADTILFQVCNNAYDTNPTWEDATSQTLLNKPYTFTNKVKTDAKWGIDIKFKITIKAGATEGIEFYGMGGSLE
jgi:hypothetical protein